MSVTTTLRKQQFVLDSTEDEFTFTFRALHDSPSDIKCIATNGAGVDTDLTYTSQYTVEVNDNGVGGTVTLVDPATVGSGTLTVYRETTNTQGSDYDDYNQFPADTVETDFDIRTLVAQENAETLDRAIVLPISISGVSTQMATPVGYELIGWNEDADALVGYDPDALPSTFTAEARTSDPTSPATGRMWIRTDL